MTSFIESQFPVSRLSKESYKERKANYSQTLTGLGKWWGRKPLILCRATLLGLLMPASDDPVRDREIFLKILTMDRDGLLRRWKNKYTVAELALLSTPEERARWEDLDGRKEDAMERVKTLRDSTKAIARTDRDARATATAEIDAAVVEVVCPETGWRVPLAPSWVIGEKSRCIARLIPVGTGSRTSQTPAGGGGAELYQTVGTGSRTSDFASSDASGSAPPSPVNSGTCGSMSLPGYKIEIITGATDDEMRAAKLGTVRSGEVIHPVLEERKLSPPSLRSIRRAGRGRVPGADYHDSGLRLWENDDLAPRPDDVFKERLYAIRWVETYTDAKGKTKTRKHYRAPDDSDLAREAHVLELLRQRFPSWQAEGFIPSARIEPGDKTDEPIRTRGWTHWHHLFNPRQLLTLGLFVEQTLTAGWTQEQKVMSLLGVMKCADNNSKLSGWSPLVGKELVDHVFANQALNTLSNHGVRAMIHLESSYMLEPKCAPVSGGSVVETSDGRSLQHDCEFWITDPPYLDAVNYHELAEFFLGWNSGGIANLFPTWSRGSRRPLAVTGSDENFRRSMVDCYRNLALHMAETGSALKKGNYVQGTVLLVLRKQTGDRTAFLDDVYPDVEAEVRAQLDAMTRIDDTESPNFGDTDYQLAAYATALRVLTQYRRLEDIDVERELARGSTSRGRSGEKSPVEQVIEQAVRIACDHLMPRGFDGFHWKVLTPAERFYLKGLELESHREFRSGAYQELARGFGLRDYRGLLGSGDANETRLRTPTEFARKLLGDDTADPFAGTLVRHALFAVKEVTAAEGNTAPGRQWLRTELADRYWQNRKTVLEVLNYLARLEHTVTRWAADAASARLLAGAVDNDHA